MLSLPLRGAGRGNGPAPSRPEPRPSARRSVAHHLGLPRRVDGRLPAQGRARCGNVLWGEANHAHPVVGPSPSSSAVVAMAAAGPVLVRQAGRRGARKRGWRRIVRAWRREKDKVENGKLANHRFILMKSINHFLQLIN